MAKKNMSPSELKKYNEEKEAKFHAKLVEMENQDLAKSIEKGEELETLIGKVKARDSLILDLVGVKIRIRRTISFRQRRRMLQLHNKLPESKGLNVEDMELLLGETYEFMAGLCLDAPWNNPDTWNQFDVQTGESPAAFGLAMELLKEEQKTIAGFRKPGGPATP